MAKVGLVLSGGGARAAYQAGVLRAIASFLPASTACPFPIVVGTSAGALNAMGVVQGAENYSSACEQLYAAWQRYQFASVYRSDWLGVVRQAGYFTCRHLLGFGKAKKPPALLDSSPLYELLAEEINFEKIQDVLASKVIESLGITAFSYASNQSITFFQSHLALNNWQRFRRAGVRTNLTLAHVYASASIPLLFAPVQLDDGYYADGAVRQSSPISPALHLGAEKVLVIALGNPTKNTKSTLIAGQPNLSNIAANLLTSTFDDHLSEDLERLYRVNQYVPLLREQEHIRSVKHVDVCVVSPSQDVDLIASKYRKVLPNALKPFLRGSGAMSAKSGGVLSYLLFHTEYCNELLELGYQDALLQKERILKFLAL